MRPVYPFPSGWDDASKSHRWVVRRRADEPRAAVPAGKGAVHAAEAGGVVPAEEADLSGSDGEYELEVNPAWIAWRRQAEQRRKLYRQTRSPLPSEIAVHGEEREIRARGARTGGRKKLSSASKRDSSRPEKPRGTVVGGKGDSLDGLAVTNTGAEEEGRCWGSRQARIAALETALDALHLEEVQRRDTPLWPQLPLSGEV